VRIEGFSEGFDERDGFGAAAGSILEDEAKRRRLTFDAERTAC
jgi:hypothetical protein